MKKLFVLIFVTVFCGNIFAQQPLLQKPHVDERVELLSIVFRLAGRPEYGDNNFKRYVDRIDAHFLRYKNHEAIEYAQSLVQENGVGYDRVMGLALKLDKNLNLMKTISLNSLYNDYGGKERTDEFVRLLKKFYKEANMKKFIKDNADIYAELESKFLPAYNMIDQKWYSSFFGKEPNEKFIILLAAGNGGGNYGITLEYPDGKRDVYSILGVGYADSPQFKAENYLPTLIHEFAHSFIHIPDKSIFEESGKNIHSLVADEKAQQAYGNWEIVLAEGFVRASVVKYMIDHGMEKSLIEREIAGQKARSFFWIEDLVKEMEAYGAQRDKYPSFADYMPVFAKAQEKYYTAGKELEEKRPRIISINEFQNGATDVDPVTKTITMNFDRPLSGKGFSIFTGNRGESAFPKSEKVDYANDNTSVVMYVNLESGKDYEFVMKGLRFMTPEGVPMKDYRVSFKTK